MDSMANNPSDITCMCLCKSVSAAFHVCLFASEVTQFSAKTDSRVEARSIPYEYVSHAKMEKGGLNQSKAVSCMDDKFILLRFIVK